ncbi:hypothetical protein FRB94_003123 [Tulasnella sp. JGI-2019a]|nr:hypothetical protein FRB94_003123 [Tulasnella sp. JGI-2019a]
MSNTTTPAVCTVNYPWMNNSLGQSPCTIGTYLESACGTHWNLVQLPVSAQYRGPSDNQTSICLCSSVTYNVVSACATCQSSTFVTWSSWAGSCPQSIIGVTKFTASIPPETAVPAWAYQDPTLQSGITFNLTAAQATAAQNIPDVTTSGSIPSTTTSSKTGIGIGAIVGIVLGALALIVLLGFLTWYLLRMRHSSRASQAPSKQYISKWSKDVQNSGHEQPAIRNGGRTTSYGGSEGRKSRDAVMMTPPDGAHYGAEGYFQSGTQPASFANAGQSMPPANTQSSKSKTGKVKRKFGSPPHAAITPFYLPPAPSNPNNTEVDNQNYPVMSSGASARTATRTSLTSSAEASGSAPAHKRQISPPELPSSIEYLSPRGTNIPPLPTAVPRPSIEYSTAPIAGRVHTRRGSGASGIATQGYYNPNDPSTFPISPIDQPAFTQPPLARQSEERIPLGSSTFLPQSSLEKLPLGVSNANADIPALPSHVGHGYPQTQGHGRPARLDLTAGADSATPPEYSGSPRSAGVRGYPSDVKVHPQSQQQTANASSRTHAPSAYAAPTSLSQHSSVASSQVARSAAPGRSNAAAGSGLVDRGWTPHARNQAEAETEFNPWGGAQ